MKLSTLLLFLLPLVPLLSRAELTVSQAPFGQLADGSQITIFTLTNAHGLEAKVCEYGATLVSMRTPDRAGAIDHIMLYPKTLEELTRGFPAGSVIGRFANRIAHASFVIDGTQYNVEKNAGKHHIHGGGRKSGFASQVWEGRSFQKDDAVGVKFTLTSPDGQAGFPGKLRVGVEYRLTDQNELVMEYSATTDKATHINLTNHAYWNLAGPESGKMPEHRVIINARRYLPTDDLKIPTGELRDVADTPYDFTQPQTIGSRVARSDGGIYDHCFALDADPATRLRIAAKVTEPTTGRAMEVFTTQPGVQLYTGNKKGLCLETQHFPNAPNEPRFSSTLLRPGDTFRETTVHKFSVVR